VPYFILQTINWQSVCKNQGASIKGAFVIGLRNFLFQLPGAEGAWH